MPDRTLQVRSLMGIVTLTLVIARGTPREIQDNVRCIEAYLGKGAAGVA